MAVSNIFELCEVERLNHCPVLNIFICNVFVSVTDLGTVIAVFLG